MQKKIFNVAKRFLPIIGILILFYIVYSLDIDKIIDSFLRIDPVFIIIALSLTFPRVVIRNYAWQMIQQEQKISIDFLDSLKIFLIGFFYGSFTPGYLGQLMRIPYMKERTNAPYGKLFVNTILEVVLHNISLYGMILLGAFLVITIRSDLFYVSAVSISIMLIILFFFVKKERGELLFNFLIKYFIPKKLKNHLYSFVDTFYNDFPSLKSLIIPIILGIFTWTIIFSQEYIVIMALDLEIPYFYFLLLYPIANIIGFVPITFAGLGTREAVAIFLFYTVCQFDVLEEEILVVSLVGFMITVVFTGFLGFILSLTEKNRKKELLKAIN